MKKDMGDRAARTKVGKAVTCQDHNHTVDSSLWRLHAFQVKWELVAIITVSVPQDLSLVQILLQHEDDAELLDISFIGYQTEEEVKPMARIPRMLFTHIV